MYKYLEEQLKIINNFFWTDWKIYSPKKDIEETCKEIGLTLNETKLVYKYFIDHLEEFMINSKTFYSSEYIVNRIIQKLNILIP